MDAARGMHMNHTDVMFVTTHTPAVVADWSPRRQAVIPSVLRLEVIVVVTAVAAAMLLLE